MPRTAHGSVSGNPQSAAATRPDPAQIFQRGQEALQRGKLDDAERDFHQVLQIDPQSGAAEANLGVVYMRRKQWNKALQSLQRAERLMPDVSGIRLNIGLAYYRQNEFLKAIPRFESVLRQEPNAAQAKLSWPSARNVHCGFGIEKSAGKPVVVRGVL